jgi:serine/threonine-protein phosphatase PGAM5
VSRQRPHRGRAVPIGLLVALVVTAAGLCGVSATDASAQQSAPRGADARGRGVRTLILIRHGLYDDNDPRDEEIGRALVPVGREQARLTGARLAAWPSRIDALHASTMTRARETADIIARALPGPAPQPDRDIRECTPPTDREDIMADLTPGEADSCRTRLDRAFARYFRPSPERDSTEVLVCHGNVIRYMVCRALGADPKLWLGMSLANCSLTVIQVKPEGGFRITAVGDRGHLPPALQTWALPRPAPADSSARR